MIQEKLKKEEIFSLNLEIIKLKNDREKINNRLAEIKKTFKSHNKMVRTPAQKLATRKLVKKNKTLQK